MNPPHLFKAARAEEESRDLGSNEMNDERDKSDKI
jgi:hypothetical protein